MSSQCLVNEFPIISFQQNMKETFSDPEQIIITPLVLSCFFLWKGPSKCNINTNKRGMKIIFANYLNTGEHWIKQLDQALFETTFWKKLPRKVGKHRCLEKGVLKILAKCIQSPVKHLRWTLLQK